MLGNRTTPVFSLLEESLYKILKGRDKVSMMGIISFAWIKRQNCKELTWTVLTTKFIDEKSELRVFSLQRLWSSDRVFREPVIPLLWETLEKEDSLNDTVRIKQTTLNSDWKQWVKDLSVEPRTKGVLYLSEKLHISDLLSVRSFQGLCSPNLNVLWK